jgi:predicted DNA-binding protein
MPEGRVKTLQLRLSAEELEKLRRAAAARGWTMAQLLREAIRSMPDSPAG